MASPACHSRALSLSSLDTNKWLLESWLDPILEHLKKNAQFQHRPQNNVTKAFRVGSANFTSEIEVWPLNFVLGIKRGEIFISIWPYTLRLWEWCILQKGLLRSKIWYKHGCWCALFRTNNGVFCRIPKFRTMKVHTNFIQRKCYKVQRKKGLWNYYRGSGPSTLYSKWKM